MSDRQTKKFGFPRTSRLIKTEDFGVILRTRGDNSFRVHSACFSAGCLENAEKGRVRVGITVGKRNSPLSVDRAIVKRALREAARQALAELREQIGPDAGLDVSLRLKVALRSLEAQSRSALKKTLHEDACALMRETIRRAGRRRRAREGGTAS